MISRKSSEKWAILSIFDIALIVIAGDLILAYLTETTPWLFQEPGIVIFNYLWAASPFALIWLWIRLGRFRAHILLACLSGEALTLAGWLWFYRDSYQALTGQAAGAGPNIGLGIVMISLPLIVLLAMGIIIVATRGKMPDDEIFVNPLP